MRRDIVIMYTERSSWANENGARDVRLVRLLVEIFQNHPYTTRLSFVNLISYHARSSVRVAWFQFGTIGSMG